jgi:hypothetical protein
MYQAKSGNPGYQAKSGNPGIKAIRSRSFFFLGINWRVLTQQRFFTVSSSYRLITTPSTPSPPPHSAEQRPSDDGCFIRARRYVKTKKIGQYLKQFVRKIGDLNVIAEIVFDNYVNCIVLCQLCQKFCKKIGKK